MLIKAEIDDLAEVMSLYDEILANAENLKYSNWERGVYPTEEFAADAIARGALFFFDEEGIKKGGVVLDNRQPDDYKKICWQYDAPTENILVIHTLCIRPTYARCGAGGRLLTDVEAYARKHDCSVIRFDTFHENIPARRMYHTNGYREAGMTEVFVYGKGRLLRCFEKKL